MAEITLTATHRDGTGKGVARQMRMKGLIPAVLYGRRTKPTGLSVNPRELFAAVSTEVGLNALIQLKIEGKDSTMVLVKDLQIDPIRREYIHADLLQVNVDDEVRVHVPVRLTGKAAGVKEGGILEQIVRNLQLLCRADSIPREVEVDISALEIGDSLHLSDLQLPKGTKAASQVNLTIAACTPPEKEEVAAPVAAVPGAEGAEGAAAAAPGAEGAAAGAAPAAGAAAPAAGGDKAKAGGDKEKPKGK